MKNAFDVVRDFEKAVADYTGAPYVVAVNSCTNALGLCMEWKYTSGNIEICLPKHTYVGVAAQAARVIKAKNPRGGVRFEEIIWQPEGFYFLGDMQIVDSARWFSHDMYNIIKDIYTPKENIVSPIVCTSHHWSKHLSTEQGGCILTDNPILDKWLRRMRFDGRNEGVAVKDDWITVLGRHCYMSPSSAALGLTNLMHLPKHNNPLPEANYPDLSQWGVFK